MPAESAASERMRWSRSWNEALRRARERATENAARVSASAVEYHTVSRPRMVSISRLHDVAHAAHRVDQPGLGGVVDLLAQTRDHHVHDVGAGAEMVGPGVLGDERARNHAALRAPQ